MEVRIGIATGEVVTSKAESGRDDLALTGSAITTAARIQSLARPAEILLDSATVAAARGRLVVADRGSFVLRGQSEPVRLHALEGEVGLGGYMTPRPRVIGTLVGRVPERQRLRALLDRCQATGTGGTILVFGEPGIGKSTLFADLEHDARARGMAWTWTDNTSYGQAEPYRFGRTFAQAAADEHGMDSGSYARALLFTPELDAPLVRLYGGAIAAIARAAAFTGWEAEATHTPADSTAVTAALVEVAGRYIDRLIETSGPRVVVVDDLHWIDASSVGMIEVLVERASRLPLVVLAAMRPVQRPSWASLPGVECIDLSGLSMPETAQLATQIARAAFDADGARRIHERTAGNPLFVTETVRASLDDGTLAWHDGRVTLIEGPARSIPLTLRAVLGARIDALTAEARDALGVASIVGMRFDQARIEDLMGAPLPPGTLERVADAGLVVSIDETSWRFSHPLIHDTAYAGVLASRRRQLHARLADQLEARQDPRAVTLIAVHRAASGDAARAIPLLEAAATSALAMGAVAEAASFWRTAADLTTDVADAEAYRSRAAAVVAAERGG